ncbi:hypothetical protein [Rhizobium sp.]
MHFKIDVSARDRMTSTMIEARDASQAVVYAYAALNIFMTGKCPSNETVTATVADEGGIRLAAISLSMEMTGATENGSGLALVEAA